MISLPFDDVSGAALERLVADGIPEGRRLEYKLDLPGGRDADVREFLADLTSLANTDGGDLIFGVQEKEVVADAVPGIGADDLDAAILRLESVARDSVDPRITGLRMRTVAIAGGRPALLVRVPGSLAGPHRVTRGLVALFRPQQQGQVRDGHA